MRGLGISSPKPLTNKFLNFLKSSKDDTLKRGGLGFNYYSENLFYYGVFRILPLAFSIVPIGLCSDLIKLGLEFELVSKSG